MLSKFALPRLHPPSKEESQQPYGSVFNPQLSLEITSDMLEAVKEYDPRKWNDFPDVEPPEGVLMRVECKNMKTCLVFENGKWRYPSGELFENYEFMFPVKRFRPWEDEE